VDDTKKKIFLILPRSIGLKLSFFQETMFPIMKGVVASIKDEVIPLFLNQPDTYYKCFHEKAVAGIGWKSKSNLQLILRCCQHYKLKGQENNKWKMISSHCTEQSTLTLFGCSDLHPELSCKSIVFYTSQLLRSANIHASNMRIFAPIKTYIPYAPLLELQMAIVDT
jgi:hypothetical protein